MMGYTFKPTIGASILTLIGALILFSLGSWQVQRLTWKNDLIETIKERMQDELIIFPNDLTDVKALDYTNGALRGRFMYDHEFFVHSRRYRGERGVHVLTPFQRLNGDIVLVNRGFVKEEDIPFIRRPETQMILNGVLHKPDDRNRFTPQNTSGSDMIYATDLDFIEHETGLKFSTPMVVYASDVKSGVPIGGQLNLDIVNDHLEYAYFWYVMCLMMIGFYFIRFVEPKRKEDD